MWTHEDSIETTAKPSKIWRLFSDVARWKNWNAGIEKVEIHGPFAKGTTFSMQAPGQNAFTSTLIEVRENESFMDETIIDGTRVVVSHKLVPLSPNRTKIIYSTEITGPSAEEFGPMVTSDFHDVLATLRDLAEKS